MHFMANISYWKSLTDLSVIISIFKFKNVGNVILLHCFELQHFHQAQKMFIENNMRVAVSHINDISAHNWLYQYSRLGVVVDTSCNLWETSFSAFHEPFQSPLSWILKSDDISKTKDILSQYPIEFTSDVNVLCNRSGSYKIYDLYNKRYNLKDNFILSEIGYWDGNLFLLTKRNKQLTGVRLQITVVYPDPIRNVTFNHFLNLHKRSQIDSLHKLKFFTLIMYLRDMYNFTYNLQRTASWGYLRNGSFDGLVGALQRKESDIGGTSVFFRKDRCEVIDYVAETWGSRICFIFRHPKHPGGSFAIYARPLVNAVWYSTVGLLLFIGAFLYSLLKLNTFLRLGGSEDTTPSLTALFVFSALGQQGMSIHRGSTAVKITIFITFMFTLTLYQYYNAMLVSTLLREPPKTIRTLTELLNSNLKIGVEDVVYNRDYLKRTTDPVAKALYREKVVTARENNFYPPIKGMELVKSGGFAFHVDTIIAYPIMRWSFTESEICEVQEVYMIPPQKMGAILQKRSPYKEHVRLGIRKMMETGVMSRLKAIWDEAKPPCVRTPGTRAFSVNIQEFSTALILLGIGNILALTVLVIENIVFIVSKNSK
ncbi:glutamate receptor ionotropic, kainate glr-3-like isoform X1 [Pieris napi]|uniref:glutamate receptor ionotropic, kainate glr-3-like isoform X1 n=1 Tax=Pieris napi TaxID=78633 RepID=UPI001FB999D8|nr:glutamate receptor ionotropic, kainate glr-3-like isoform X1 [Pieris napi]